MFRARGRPHLKRCHGQARLAFADLAAEVAGEGGEDDMDLELRLVRL